MNAAIPLKQLLVSFSSLLLLGIGLSVPLFKFDYRRFARSALLVKILFWIPIFGLFLGVLYAPGTVRLLVLAGLLLAASSEFVRVLSVSGRRPVLTAYFLLFAAGLAHFWLLASYRATFVNLLITICFGSVLSDVGAFLAGSYGGKHKLPSWLNASKSWEGVVGQIVGAGLGVLLVNSYIEPVITVWLFVPLGLGSALGDLANSFAKRQAGVKDWSRAIPGHGGFIDRLSSLAGSAALTFYFLKTTGLG